MQEVVSSTNNTVADWRLQGQLLTNLINISSFKIDT